MNKKSELIFARAMSHKLIFFIAFLFSSGLWLCYGQSSQTREGTKPQPSLNNSTEDSRSQSSLSNSGPIFFDSKGSVPGNIENAISDLKSIYGVIRVFKMENGGRYPQGHRDLIRIYYRSLRLTQESTKQERVAAFKQVMSHFTNPDAIYDDSPTLRQNPDSVVAYPIANRRFDGTLIGSPATVGARDILSYTTLYFHVNSFISQGETVNNPVGVFPVLWSDGEIDLIPFDLTLFSSQDSAWIRTFPSQAGTPQESISYSEFWLQWGKTEAPVGKPVSAKGLILDNGGPESLVHLSRRLSYPNRYGLDREKLWQVFNPTQWEYSLGQVQTSAKNLGLDTQLQKKTLSHLQKIGTPALLFLQDDGRIVTLTAVDDDRAVVIDRGLTQNVERSVLERRYSGEALVPTKALTQNAAIVADDAVREVKLPSLDAEVSQQFVLRNTGTTPITLQLEYPLLGVTESKLSRDVIPPGETATLDLKVKWRSILKAPYQNVLVSLQTNDPIVPRLQLAILLTPPATANAK